MTLQRQDLEGGVSLLTIDRPDARNALSPPIRDALAMSCRSMAQEDGVRAVVLTGAGDHFCAGGDVKTMGGQDRNALEERYAAMARAAEAVILFPKPLIAAVRGHAAGAGVGLACLADVVIADASAKFTLSFLNMGLVPDWGLSHTLPRRVGAAAARRLALTADRLDAFEAHRLGLVDRCVEESDLMNAALAQAKSLAAMAPGAIAAIKAMGEDPQAVREALRNEARNQLERALTGEHREGVAAFREKRAPDFTP
ncbi:MAG: enoyl-CoA hydratase/isomerase family protein [Ectothiorhodospiraceae bacterium AqS1]|nr:enoyl-CoA hydratase/isomerase family protein [Ectothiorhodospiraceae bacterium AqS1]